MVKQIIAFLLLLACTCQTFNKAVIVTGYYANTAAYAKNCENKAKPKLHCNGKCQMMKKLKQEENKDTQNPERHNNTNEVISSKSFFASIHIVKFSHPKAYFPFNNMEIKDISFDFFHPPGI